MATYIVNYTTAASRNFTSIEPRLIASHRKFDSSASPAAIKIITYYLHCTEVNRLTVGDGTDASNARWIRIVIEVPKGAHSDERKQELMRLTTAACLDYQGKHAEGCEVEVRIVELDESNVMRTNARA